MEIIDNKSLIMMMEKKYENMKVINVIVNESEENGNCHKGIIKSIPCDHIHGISDVQMRLILG